MDLFNRSFFRFAFGFLGIIFVSVTIILIVSAVSKAHGSEKICFLNCASAK